MIYKSLSQRFEVPTHAVRRGHRASPSWPARIGTCYFAAFFSCVALWLLIRFSSPDTALLLTPAHEKDLAMAAATFLGAGFSLAVVFRPNRRTQRDERITK